MLSTASYDRSCSNVVLLLTWYNYTHQEPLYTVPLSVSVCKQNRKTSWFPMTVATLQPPIIQASDLPWSSSMLIHNPARALHQPVNTQSTPGDVSTYLQATKFSQEQHA